jgi:hypothetical protein
MSAVNINTKLTSLAANFIESVLFVALYACA